MAYFFIQINPTDSDWAIIEQSHDANCFFTRQWTSYLESIGRKSFIVRVLKNNILIGHFIGIKRRIIISTIGAPPDATGTYSQGLCMIEETSYSDRINIYQELWGWICEHHIASYMQVCDWQLKSNCENDIIFPDEFHYQPRYTLVVDTRQSEEQLWAGLHYKSCKYSINKARKLGLSVRQITKKEEIASFVDIHYKHLLDVCHRKGMKPQPYQSKTHLMTLCKHLFPEKIKLLQVIGHDDKDGEVIMSSAIFCLGNSASTYFTGASFHKYMKYCPNELMVWEGMKLLHEQGAGNLIFGGTAHYKTKFGTHNVYIPMIVFSNYHILYDVRVILKKSYTLFRKIQAKIKNI